MIVKLELTAPEAKALLQAALLQLADEYDGTERERAALERAKDKLLDQTWRKRRARDRVS
jgi:hypothetical protein